VAPAAAVAAAAAVEVGASVLRRGADRGHFCGRYRCNDEQRRSGPDAKPTRIYYGRRSGSSPVT